VSGSRTQSRRIVRAGVLVVSTNYSERAYATRNNCWPPYSFRTCKLPIANASELRRVRSAVRRVQVPFRARAFSRPRFVFSLSVVYRPPNARRRHNYNQTRDYFAWRKKTPPNGYNSVNCIVFFFSFLSLSSIGYVYNIYIYIHCIIPYRYCVFKLSSVWLFCVYSYMCTIEEDVRDRRDHLLRGCYRRAWRELRIQKRRRNKYIYKPKYEFAIDFLTADS